MIWPLGASSASVETKQDSNEACISRLMNGFRLFPQVRLFIFSTKFYAENNGERAAEVLG